MYKGSCLCGAAKFEVSGALETTDACHCNQCRKWTGHFLASAEVSRDSLSIYGSENLSWHHSSEKVRRGFCSKCGSSLFFDPLDTDKHHWIGISLGAFDTPTGTNLGQHIFVAEKGDYYEITDGLPQNDH
ncbi:GFA family protein [Photobacterium frigidiphilum]|uniref:Aldehyde-activating protein n=1 Tax=Photobacterium frigidiphilum TaxID=264736 RepID=A0A2T3JKJ3_9GAMM|nr:GFA family protein [Photobacterium frigidiphilum]PSU49525.1 aldehyde-activating protein [Photobacterium frigidiphilum]